ETVAEFCQARPGPAGNDLVKGIEGIEGAGSQAGRGICGPAERGRPGGISNPGRDGQRGKAGALEISRGRWRQLIVRLYVLIHSVGVDDEFIAKDLVVHRDVTAVALGRRKREREFIEVKAVRARSWPAGPVEISAGRS